MSDIKVLEGYGVTVSHGDPLVELPGVMEVEPPKPEMADVERSHMQSPGRAKQYKPGWAEPGDMTVTIHYDPAVVAALHTTRAARTVENWKVQFIDGSNFTNEGYIKSVGTPVEREGLVTVEIAVKLSGEPTFAVAA